MDSYAIPIALAIGLLAIVLFFVMRRSSSTKPEIVVLSPTPPHAAGAGAKAASTVSAPKGPKVAIYYGSQTGTAEGFAKKLSEEFRDRSFNAKVIDLDEFDESTFVEHENVVVVIATYGEGEPTDNARNFHKWITDKSLDDTTMAHANFLVFGLGNRQYDHYQAMGVLVDTRLAELGAKRMFKRGEGDDDGSIEDDFTSWREEMWPEVMKFFGLSGEGVTTSSVHKFKYALEWRSSDDPPVIARASSSSLDAHAYSHAQVTRNDELHTALSSRSCRHIEIDISRCKITYETGDHVAIAPHNPLPLVEGLATRLGVDLDDAKLIDMVALQPEDRSKSLFPCPCSVRTALTQYVEVNSIKKTLLSTLASFAADPKEAARLVKMASKEGKDEFDAYAIAGMRTMLDLLSDFPSISIPLGAFLELMPRMQPRYYSIASSSLTHPQSIHVAASVEHVILESNREFNGVCTSYLASLPPGAQVDIFVRHSSFKLPKLLSTPCIMIGPGTGFAPLRGFIQELTHAKQSQGVTLGRNVLFFGSQHRQHDFIYEREMMEAAERGVLWRTHFAFSREQAHKVYVQNKIEEDRDTVLTLLRDEGAFLYICGASRMAKDVRATITKAAAAANNWQLGKAEEWLHELQQAGRFQQDVW